MSAASSEAEQGSRLLLQFKDDARKRVAVAQTSRDPVVASVWSARRTLCFIMLTCGAFWTTALVLLLR